MAELEALLDEFKAAFEAGDRPNPRSILERASPDQRQTLAAQIDSYLMNAPRRAWDAAAYAESPARESVERVWESLEGASEGWPELLPHLRNKAKIKRAELVRRLAEALGVEDRAEKVGGYYHDMEHGRLPARGISAQVFDALGEILGVSAERIRSAGLGMAPPAAGAQALYTRVASLADEPGSASTAGFAAASPSPGRPRKAARDEVDELFTGG